MKPLKIGIAGLGNVGEEVAYQLIKGFRVQKNLFQIELVAVSAKTKNKKRKININNLKLLLKNNSNLRTMLENYVKNFNLVTNKYTDLKLILDIL